MNSEHSQIEHCCQTGMPICRRMFNMNLALGYIEEFYSLKALANKHGRSMEDIFEMGYEYVESRECFKKEWDKMTDRSECPLAKDCLIDKCFS